MWGTKNMTPEEEALEICLKIYYNLPNNGFLKEGINSCDSRWKEAKTCGIINVDKIINVLSKASDLNMLYRTDLVVHYQQVKNEIENL